LTGLVFCGSTTATSNTPKRIQDKDLRQEESEDYFDKWLKEDVVYIITPDEKEIFQSLSSPEEKERFIEQFWMRRDSNPATALNEFREEHYRRIAYANDNFQSGWPGWMTDRGRIYIIHGPPVEIQSHPAGERYDRPMYEGGGTTSTHAYITWRYRYIEGVGTDVVLEFVDDSFSGEYRLAKSAQDKDAFLHIAEQGLTLAEQMGGSKDDQSYFM
jgi:GWxTD domain-containing protein